MPIAHNQLQQIRRANKGKKPKKGAKWLFPINAEKDYRKLLRQLVKDITQAVRQFLIPAIPEMLAEAESNMPNDSIKTDDFLSRLQGIFISIREYLAPIIETAINEIPFIGNQIADYNETQFQKVNRSIFGIDIFIEEPYLQDQLALFARQNTQLITSLPEQDLLQIAGIVERGLQEGRRFTELVSEIQKRVGITTRRANLIARDQTAKLNASLTMLRQQNIGIKTYRWQTSGDERVRASHRVMDGKICSWENPTIYLNEKNGKWEKKTCNGN